MLKFLKIELNDDNTRKDDSCIAWMVMHYLYLSKHFSTINDKPDYYTNHHIEINVLLTFVPEMKIMFTENLDTMLRAVQQLSPHL